MKRLLTFLALISIFATILPVGQATAKSDKERMILLPPHSEGAEVVYLGQAKDPKNHQSVEGYAFIFNVRGVHSSKPGGSGKVSNCYSYIANGAKWNYVEDWIVNTDNSRGLESSSIADNLSADIAKWEDAANGIVGDGIEKNILGSGSVTSDLLAADMIAPDNKNEIYFADISDSGVIGLTVVWGIFSGPSRFRKIVEWDLIFDGIDFDWSATGESGKMDFENIATHELGHATGMGDLYENSCNLETMFGYASEGEIIKRDLNSGDILGIDKLY